MQKSWALDCKNIKCYEIEQEKNVTSDEKCFESGIQTDSDYFSREFSTALYKNWIKILFAFSNLTSASKSDKLSNVELFDYMFE